MNAYVLDCSIAAAWLFPDEATSETDSLLNILQTKKAVVPNLWHLEISNVLRQAEKKGRLSSDQIRMRLKTLNQLPIITDLKTSQRAFQEIYDIASTFALTTYDAAYLELALRLKLPLATLDRALIKAALSIDIQILPAHTPSKN